MDMLLVDSKRLGNLSHSLTICRSANLDHSESIVLRASCGADGRVLAYPFRAIRLPAISGRGLKVPSLELGLLLLDIDKAIAEI